ncbi:uncharacterized protein LOC110446959 [Mizuhopecten yessoensis]|uniref:Uncharacterized protein n=1 Tax=Mizuhopecten yessoensis TaxID=6573 RepID=A0A210QW99_MIZYE|nr:uncharacterized protein LOC110446959 [Mizuhopecten yessoensis]OWF53015.1 hypothetical protein KP79_PYT18671 [Mizuhopecten yessoensis]
MTTMPRKKRNLVDILWKNYRKKRKLNSEGCSDLDDFKFASKAEPCTSTDGCLKESSEFQSSCLDHLYINRETTLSTVSDHNYATRETTPTSPDGVKGYSGSEITHVSSDDNHSHAGSQIKNTAPENNHDYTKSQICRTSRKNDHSYAGTQMAHSILKNSPSNAESLKHHTKPEKDHSYAESPVTHDTLENGRSKKISQITCTTLENGQHDSTKIQKTHTSPENGYGHAEILTARISTDDGSSERDINRTFEIKVPIFNSDVVSIKETLEELAEEVRHKLQPPYVFSFQEDEIKIIELYKIKRKTSVKLVINIDRTFQAKIYVHRKEVSRDHHLWTGLPPKYDSYSSISQLLTQLQSFAVCMGNPDEGFYDLAAIGCELSDSKDSSIHGYREGDFCAQLGDLDYHSTVRSVKCSLLVPGRRCSTCGIYRRRLWSRKHRLDDKSKLSTDLMHSSYKHKDMTKEMLILKIKQQRACVLSLQHEVDRLQREIKRFNPVPKNAL